MKHALAALLGAALSTAAIAAVDPRFAAEHAMKPLVSELIFSEFLSLVVLAGLDNHCGVAFSSGLRYNPKS